MDMPLGAFTPALETFGKVRTRIDRASRSGRPRGSPCAADSNLNYFDS